MRYKTILVKIILERRLFTRRDIALDLRMIMNPLGIFGGEGEFLGDCGSETKKSGQGLSNEEICPGDSRRSDESTSALLEDSFQVGESSFESWKELLLVESVLVSFSTSSKHHQVGASVVTGITEEVSSGVNESLFVLIFSGKSESVGEETEDGERFRDLVSINFEKRNFASSII